MKTKKSSSELETSTSEENDFAENFTNFPLFREHWKPYNIYMMNLNANKTFQSKPTIFANNEREKIVPRNNGYEQGNNKSFTGKKMVKRKRL